MLEPGAGPTQAVGRAVIHTGSTRGRFRNSAQLQGNQERAREIREGFPVPGRSGCGNDQDARISRRVPEHNSPGSPNDDNLRNRITSKWQRTIAVMRMTFSISKKNSTKSRRCAAWKNQKAGRTRQLYWISGPASDRIQLRVQLGARPGKTQHVARPRRYSRTQRLALGGGRKIHSPRAIRNWLAKAQKTLAQIVIDHPKTPWAVLAEKHKEMKLGLNWQPVKLDE